jgi:hypothetical protein
MKNILAENMLRFGVKNLSEADRYHLTEITGSTPAAAKPTQVAVEFATTLGPGKILGYLYKQSNGSFVQGPKIAIYRPDKMHVDIKLNDDKTSWIFDPASSKDKDTLYAWLYENKNPAMYIGGIKPSTVLNQVVAQLNKAAGTNVTIAGDILSALTPSYQNVGTILKSEIATQKILKPMKTASMKVYLDPETKKEMRREMNIGGTGTYIFVKGASGKILPAGGSSDLMSSPLLKAGAEAGQFDKQALYGELESLWGQLTPLVK